MGLGEREARIFSALVSQRHYRSEKPGLRNEANEKAEMRRLQIWSWDWTIWRHCGSVGNQVFSFDACSNIVWPQTTESCRFLFNPKANQLFGCGRLENRRFVEAFCQFLLQRSSFLCKGASKASTAACLVFPMATGMTLALALRALKQKRGERAKYVVMPRIDQKSCMKAILTAGGCRCSCF